MTESEFEQALLDLIDKGFDAGLSSDFIHGVLDLRIMALDEEDED